MVPSSRSQEKALSGSHPRPGNTWGLRSQTLHRGGWDPNRLPDLAFRAHAVTGLLVRRRSCECRSNVFFFSCASVRKIWAVNLRLFFSRKTANPCRPAEARTHSQTLGGALLACMDGRGANARVSSHRRISCRSAPHPSKQPPMPASSRKATEANCKQNSRGQSLPEKCGARSRASSTVRSLCASGANPGPDGLCRISSPRQWAAKRPAQQWNCRRPSRAKRRR
ncbi:hypothetical protein B0J18DRAFT_223733 [Chaetomium sp. MPI-SDFR-AT-0129]|nr:hypothetical protein B0J18DRAFT_223733 [Chaetomium sp. MPI-SDFR-AT-0129]